MAALADEADEGTWDQQSYCSCMNSKLAHCYTQEMKKGKTPHPDQPRLDNKLKASTSYIRRPCLKSEGLEMHLSL